MGNHVWDRWRERHGHTPAPVVDPAALNELLAECPLLRELARDAGVSLDDTPASLDRLDQLLPRWREDPETASWLGNDAGLYLGTVIVRTVSGSGWLLAPDGYPVVRMAGGREVEVVLMGQSWAAEGVPELSAVYAEIDEG